LSLIIVVAIALVAALGRLIGGSWRHPGALFAGFWFLTCTPALLAIPEEVSLDALLLVLQFSLCVVAGSEIGRALWRCSRRSVDDMPRVASVPPGRRLYLVYVVAIFVACGFGASVLYLVEGEATLASLLSIDGWIENAAFFSVARYFEDYVEPLPLRVLSAMNYAGAFLGGVLMAVGTRRSHRVIAVLPLLFGLLMTAITTAKAGSLLCALFFISSYGAITCCDRRGGTSGGVLPVVGGLAVMGVMVIVAMVLRYGMEDSLGGLLVERLASYAFGHMAALSAWLDWEGVASVGPLLGLRSFSGLADALGLAQRIPGTYSAIPLGMVAEGTNVFTAFRGLIEDFTLAGAFAVTALLSMGAGFAFALLRDGRRSPIAIATLTGFFAFVGWSPVVNVFMYNVVLLAFAVFMVVLVGLRVDATWARGSRDSRGSHVPVIRTSTS
jgi:oligosaccharide repeat unit polymerase